MVVNYNPTSVTVDDFVVGQYYKMNNTGAGVSIFYILPGRVVHFTGAYSYKRFEFDSLFASYFFTELNFRDVLAHLIIANVIPANSIEGKRIIEAMKVIEEKEKAVAYSE